VLLTALASRERLVVRPASGTSEGSKPSGIGVPLSSSRTTLSWSAALTTVAGIASSQLPESTRASQRSVL
jgi:hypothetical protein